MDERTHEAGYGHINDTALFHFNLPDIIVSEQFVVISRGYYASRPFRVALERDKPSNSMTLLKAIGSRLARLNPPTFRTHGH